MVPAAEGKALPLKAKLTLSPYLPLISKPTLSPTLPLKELRAGGRVITLPILHFQRSRVRTRRFFNSSEYKLLMNDPGR